MEPLSGEIQGWSNLIGTTPTRLWFSLKVVMKIIRRYQKNTVQLKCLVVIWTRQRSKGIHHSQIMMWTRQWTSKLMKALVSINTKQKWSLLRIMINIKKNQRQEIMRRSSQNKSKRTITRSNHNRICYLVQASHLVQTTLFI